MKTTEIVAALNALDGVDAEVAHDLADELLLKAVPPVVAGAYERLQARATFWAYA